MDGYKFQQKLELIRMCQDNRIPWTGLTVEQMAERIWNRDLTCKTKRDIVKTAAALSKTIAHTG